MDRDILVLIITTLATLGTTITNLKNLTRLFTGKGVGIFQLILCIMNIGLLIAAAVLWVLFIKDRNDPENNTDEGVDSSDETASSEETALPEKTSNQEEPLNRN